MIVHVQVHTLAGTGRTYDRINECTLAQVQVHTHVDTLVFATTFRVSQKKGHDAPPVSQSVAGRCSFTSRFGGRAFPPLLLFD